MIYYRSQSGRRDLKLGASRVLSLTALAAYPVGASLLAQSDALAAAVLGYGLIFVALLSAALMIGSGLQRIVGEQPDQLDEYELKLRARAMAGAYGALSAMLLVGVIYLTVASDAGWWIPSSYEEYNGLFWGVALYAAVLPGALLAWQVEPAEFGRED